MHCSRQSNSICDNIGPTSVYRPYVGCFHLGAATTIYQLQASYCATSIVSFDHPAAKQSVTDKPRTEICRPGTFNLELKWGAFFAKHILGSLVDSWKKVVIFRESKVNYAIEVLDRQGADCGLRTS